MDMIKLGFEALTPEKIEKHVQDGANPYTRFTKSDKGKTFSGKLLFVGDSKRVTKLNKKYTIFSVSLDIEKNETTQVLSDLPVNISFSEAIRLLDAKGKKIQFTIIESTSEARPEIKDEVGNITQEKREQKIYYNAIITGIV